MSACRRHASVVTIVTLFVLSSSSHSRAAEILYTFENPGDNSSTLIDSLSGDGSQNATYGYSSGNVVPNSGTGVLHTTTQFKSPSAQPPGEMIITDSVIAYPTAMTWSAAIKPTEATASGYASLFWSGWQRGAGETAFDITPTGSLTWYQAGGPGSVTTPATGLIAMNKWQSVGITFDGSIGTLIFYLNGAPIHTATGLGPMINNGNAQGISETNFGLTFNVGGQFSSQFIGYADNIFMAGRALSATEMEALQYIPEPSLAGVCVIAGVLGGMGAQNAVVRRAR